MGRHKVMDIIQPLTHTLPLLHRGVPGISTKAEPISDGGSASGITY